MSLERIIRLSEEFHKWSLRERLLALVATTIALYFILFFSLVVPQNKKILAAHQLQKSHQTELAAIVATTTQMETEVAAGQNPFAEKQAELEALQKKIAEAETFFQYGNGSGSAQTSELVSDMLSSSPQVSLVSLRILPVEMFFQPQNAPQGPQTNGLSPGMPIYKHGVEVVVKGSYGALLGYMEHMRQAPRRLFWGDAQLDVSAYPDSVLKLVIYTLSDKQVSPL